MSSKKKNKKRFGYPDSNAKEITYFSVLKRGFIFSIISALLFLLFCLIFSLFFFRTPDPCANISLISTISIFLSVFISSIFMSRGTTEKNLIGGLFLGVIALTISYVITLALREGNQTNMALKLLIPAFSIAGALIGKKREKLKKRHR